MDYNKLYNGLLVSETAYNPSKMTDMNHLVNFYKSDPAKFDKFIVNFFTQEKMLAEPFLEELESAPIFEIDTLSDMYQYQVRKFSENAKIVENLVSGVTYPGIDRQPFLVKMDKKQFVQNDLISYDVRDGMQFKVLDDAQRDSGGYIYKLQIVTDNKAQYARQVVLKVGTEYMKLGSSQGEFDTRFSQINFDGHLTLMDKLGSEFGVEHTVTSWAIDGALDPTKQIQTFNYRNEESKQITGGSWLPIVEAQQLAEHKRMKAYKMMFGQTGTTDDGNGNSKVYDAPGLWQQMHRGNVNYFNQGAFNAKLLDEQLGDLYYRRVPAEKRKTVIYTNEAGFEVFSNAVSDVFKQVAGNVLLNGDKVVGGQGLDMSLAYGFTKYTSQRAGEVTLKHLQMLDTPQTNLQFGTNKRSEPVFMIMDISNKNEPNLHQIKKKNYTSMRWFYLKGTTGSPYGRDSKVFQAGTRDPWDTMITKERCGVKLFDPSRTVIFKQNSDYYKVF